MKKLPAIFILVVIGFSCGKNEEKNDWIFTWDHLFVSENATSANAYITQIDLGKGPNQIIASNGRNTSYRVNMRLTSLDANTYNVSLSTNKFDYIDHNGFVLAGARGTVTISSNSNGRLAGNFSVKLINASSDTTLISGFFSNILVHQ